MTRHNPYLDAYEGFVLTSVADKWWRWERPGTRNMQIDIIDAPDGAVMWGDALQAPVAFRYKSAAWLFVKTPHGLDYFAGKVAGTREEFRQEYLDDDIETLRDDPDFDEIVEAYDALYPKPETYEGLVESLRDALPRGFDMMDVYEYRPGWGPTDDVLRAHAAHRAIVAALGGDAAPLPERTTTLSACGDRGEADYAVAGCEGDPCIVEMRYAKSLTTEYDAYGWDGKGFVDELGAFQTPAAALAALNNHGPTRQLFGRLVLPPEAP